MNRKDEIKAGDSYEVVFPFFKDIYSGYDENGMFEQETWVPGCRTKQVMPDDVELVADGQGTMILSVVDVHKPGKYPERVFYTRNWLSPDGNEFGSSRLYITTTPAFKRRASGYLYDYRIEE